MQLSDRVRNARANAIEATVGASAKLLLFATSKSVNCAASDPSGLLATIDLPADWRGAAASGITTKLGTWSGTASGSGAIASYRIKDSSLANCDMQGNVTAEGDGGEMEVDNVNVVTGQTVTVTAFTLTEGNA